MADAWDWWRMCPAEINGRIEAFKARMRHNDQQAWSIAKYTSIGVNAPKKFPSKPALYESNEQKHANEPMSDDEMKDVMRSFVKKGGGDGGNNA